MLEAFSTFFPWLDFRNIAFSHLDSLYNGHQVTSASRGPFSICCSFRGVSYRSNIFCMVSECFVFACCVLRKSRNLPSRASVHVLLRVEKTFSLGPSVLDRHIGVVVGVGDGVAPLLDNNSDGDRSFTVEVECRDNTILQDLNAVVSHDGARGACVLVGLDSLRIDDLASKSSGLVLGLLATKHVDRPAKVLDIGSRQLPDQLEDAGREVFAEQSAQIVSVSEPAEVIVLHVLLVLDGESLEGL